MQGLVGTIRIRIRLCRKADLPSVQLIVEDQTHNGCRTQRIRNVRRRRRHLQIQRHWRRGGTPHRHTSKARRRRRGGKDTLLDLVNVRQRDLDDRGRMRGPTRGVPRVRSDGGLNGMRTEQ